MKRTLFSIVTLICMLSVFCLSVPAAAATETEMQTPLISFAEEFLEKRARVEWLYEDHDLSAYFTGGTSGSLSAAATNFLDTMEYYKSFRRSNGTFRNDFSVSYTNHSIQPLLGGYTISLLETVSFVIDDGLDLLTTISEEYTLTVLLSSDSFRITDVAITYDSFYNRIKDTGFDKDATLAAHADMMSAVREQEAAVASQTVETEHSVTPQSTTNTITYNPSAAVNYAKVFAENYNSNFSSFSADCANFASQCIWAGFGGNNVSSAISSRQYPMDKSGSYLWYPGQTSWSGTNSMVDYATSMKTAASTEAGWLSNVNEYSSAVNLPTMDYKGAILMIPGRNPSNEVVNYGHAVVAVYGTSYSTIRYCGHTGNALNAQLSDFSDFIIDQQASKPYPDSNYRPIKVIMPTQYRLYSTCTHSYSSIPSGSGMDSICNTCGESRFHFILSGGFDSVNNSTLISGYEANSLKPYSIDVYVYNSSGTLVTSYAMQNNRSNFSFSYNFASTGLYTVRVDVEDCDGSTYDETTQSFYSYVRIS